MKRFWMFFYNVVVIPLFWVSIFIAAGLKRKVRRGIRGRKDLFPQLALHVADLPAGSKRVWFHSSSLGEFEQAKPIIAQLKSRHPEISIIVSFFSPSGYDHSKNFKLADVHTYIPFDSYGAAHRFIACMKPDVAIMVRYDIWPNHVWALHKAGIATYLANATMKESSLRSVPLAKSFHRAIYDTFHSILTVSEADAAAFRNFNLKHPSVVPIGDTRYDQVLQRSAEARLRHILPQQLQAGKKVFVVGSSWDSDEGILIPVLAKLAAQNFNLLTILVPHEPTLENLEQIERALYGKLPFIRFSDLHDYADEKVIIIDSVGILTALYQYADVAFVGGSFKQGIHNVLEAAVYGVPVLMGPVHTNSQEAIALAGEGAAFAAHTEAELFEHLQILLSDDTLRHNSGAKAKAFVERNTGATERFLSYLEKVL